jgi:site-specific DNA recombinase
MFHGSNQLEPASGLRAAIYTRYSSDMQRPASLEDQERNCRKFAEEHGGKS